jgi:hypothetical protein
MKYRFSEFFNKELIEEAKFNGKSVGITSKMWILPNGRVATTGGDWHYQWALNNKENLEKMGITFEGKDENTIRKELIKQGMFRLNHEARSNRVTIEGVAKYYNSRIKDAILGLVMDNAWSFAYLKITLFDDAITKIVKDRGINLIGKGEKEKVDSVSDLLGESIEETPDSE